MLKKCSTFAADLITRQNYYKYLTYANNCDKKSKILRFMSKKRKINALVAIAIFAALALNSACESNGWPLVGNIFGWLLIVGGLFMVVDHRFKEEEQ